MGVWELLKRKLSGSSHSDHTRPDSIDWRTEGTESAGSKQDPAFDGHGGESGGAGATGGWDADASDSGSSDSGSSDSGSSDSGSSD